MKSCVVTSADVVYIEGVRALYFSFKKHNPDVDFVLFAHGEPSAFVEFDELPGCKVFYNEETIHSPTSSNWPVEMPAMYSRLLMTKLLDKDYDRCLWLDADVIVIKSLEELLNMDMKEQPVAACLCHRPQSPNDPLNFLPFQFADKPNFGLRDVKTLQAGVYLVDNKKWNALELDKEVDSILSSGITFKFVVQGVLGYALMGRFEHIDLKWNWRPGLTPSPSEAHIVHYVGGAKVNPWLGTAQQAHFWKEAREGYRKEYSI